MNKPIVQSDVKSLAWGVYDSNKNNASSEQKDLLIEKLLESTTKNAFNDCTPEEFLISSNQEVTNWSAGLTLQKNRKFLSELEEELIKNLIGSETIVKIYLKRFTNCSDIELWVITNNYNNDEFRDVTKKVMTFEMKSKVHTDYIYVDIRELIKEPEYNLVFSK